MPYMLSLNYPVVYHANNDDQARLIAAHIEDVFAGTLPHEAELSDVPEVRLDYVESGSVERTIFSPDSLTRYAPLAAGNVPDDDNVAIGGISFGGPCPVCAEHDATYNRPDPEPDAPEPKTTFYLFCNVCCADYIGQVDIWLTDPLDATLALVAQERRNVEHDALTYPENPPIPFTLRHMQPGIVETETRYLATADNVPPCGRCGRPITEHEPVKINLQTCRFNHPERQSAP